MNNLNHDVFLDDPIQRQALSFLLDGIFDSENNSSLQQRTRDLTREPFMELLPENRRSLVAALAAKRAHDALDDVLVMEILL